MIQKKVGLAIALIAIGVIGLLIIGVFFSRDLNMNRALELAENYLDSMNNPDLAIDEIMEFEQNFYVIYFEKSTGIGAFEMLIDKSSGRIFPEYGPNMMWNNKYGHGGMMGGWSQPPSEFMLINRSEALSRAQEYLDKAYPGTISGDPHPFYGYFTIHVEKEGEIYGMLSVNGYDGEIWYHNWHGRYIQSREMH